MGGDENGGTLIGQAPELSDEEPHPVDIKMPLRFIEHNHLGGYLKLCSEEESLALTAGQR